MLTAGGQNQAGFKKVTELFSFATMKWRLVADHPIRTIGALKIISIKDIFYCFGGSALPYSLNLMESFTLSTIFGFDPNKNKWFEAGKMTRKRRLDFNIMVTKEQSSILNSAKRFQYWN